MTGIVLTINFCQLLQMRCSHGVLLLVLIQIKLGDFTVQTARH